MFTFPTLDSLPDTSNHFLPASSPLPQTLDYNQQTPPYLQTSAQLLLSLFSMLLMPVTVGKTQDGRMIYLFGMTQKVVITAVLATYWYHIQETNPDSDNILLDTVSQEFFCQLSSVYGS